MINLILPVFLFIPLPVTALVITSFPYILILPFSAGFTFSTYVVWRICLQSSYPIKLFTVLPSHSGLFPSHYHLTPQISIQCFYFWLPYPSLQIPEICYVINLQKSESDDGASLLKTMYWFFFASGKATDSTVWFQNCVLPMFSVVLSWHPPSRLLST